MLVSAQAASNCNGGLQERNVVCVCVRVCVYVILLTAYLSLAKHATNTGTIPDL